MPRRQPTATAAPRRGFPRRLPTTVVLAALTVVVLLSPVLTARAGAGWRLPVDHAAVVGGFRVTPGAPFAAGQRRGIDLRARTGAPVRAACSGRVTFAGRTPAGTMGVTVRCGALAATHLGLAARLRIRRGVVVPRGALLGRVGSSGIVRLGARHVADRRGYVDPLALLHAEAEPPPLVAPPPGTARPVRRLPPPPSPPGVLPAPARSPARTPAVAWLGLALAAAGVPVTVVARRRRRRALRLAGRPLPPVA